MDNLTKSILFGTFLTFSNPVAGEDTKKINLDKLLNPNQFNSDFKNQSPLLYSLNLSNISDFTNPVDFNKIPVNINRYTPDTITYMMMRLDKLEYTSQIDIELEPLEISLENTFIANFCNGMSFLDSIDQRMTILKNLYEFKEGLYNLGYYKKGHYFSDMYEHKELSQSCELARKSHSDTN